MSYKILPLSCILFRTMTGIITQQRRHVSSIIWFVNPTIKLSCWLFWRDIDTSCAKARSLYSERWPRRRAVTTSMTCSTQTPAVYVQSGASATMGSKSNSFSQTLRLDWSRLSPHTRVRQPIACYLPSKPGHWAVESFQMYPFPLICELPQRQL